MSVLRKIEMSSPVLAFGVLGCRRMTLVVMSSKELGRVGVLRDVDADRMTPADAASALGVSVRQVFRLLKIFRSAGASALASRRRGRPSNRRYPAAIRDQ